MMAAMPDHVLAACAIVVAYLAFCGAILRLHRNRAAAQSPPFAAGPSPADQRNVPPTLIAYATQTGYAEEVARQTARALQDASEGTRVIPVGELDRATMGAAQRILFVVSTTGEGDVPDAAAGFARNVMTAVSPLPALRYGVLALGDRSFANFCAFGRTLDGWLREQGATPLFDRIEVDNADDAALRKWHDNVSAATGTSGGAEWTPLAYSRWRLVERRLLNAGSPGGPIYCIGLKPSDRGAHWVAGDIAEVRPDASDANGAQRDWRREYSIASIPEDGVLQLLVRQARRRDGTPGLGSGWLTETVPMGGDVALRIRTNRSFHLPHDGRPLLFIGNGTGIGGLRALLKARARAGHRRNWLLFGERTEVHDFHFGAEIRQWVADGTLQRVDLAFSRDQARRVYVQDRLRGEAKVVRAWVSEGAAIYVCGGRAGMASGVDEAMRSVLGDGVVEQLLVEGRYRRDVY